MPCRAVPEPLVQACPGETHWTRSVQARPRCARPEDQTRPGRAVLDQKARPGQSLGSRAPQDCRRAMSLAAPRNRRSVQRGAPTSGHSCHRGEAPGSGSRLRTAQSSLRTVHCSAPQHARLTRERHHAAFFVDSEESFWSGWNIPAWCSRGRRPLIAGCLSLQRLWSWLTRNPPSLGLEPRTSCIRDPTLNH